ncbi:MAG: hypothetical protein K0V04_34395 [Deltaproteobacteria bacterium]|nr:hypothetical protein [Deltaproteobacteria bacterium]
MLEEDEILWDVVEEHLDEAEFLVELWRNARASPAYTLHELRDGPQSRLLAHTDGLVINGPVALDKLAWPDVSRSDDPMRLAAAALAMLDAGDFRPLDASLDDAADEPAVVHDPDMPQELLDLEALPFDEDDDWDDEDEDEDDTTPTDDDAGQPDEAPPSSPRAEGLGLAIALCEHPGIADELRSRCAKAQGASLRMLLLACADRGIDLGSDIQRGLTDSNLRVVEAAVIAAVHGDPKQWLGPVESLLRHPDAPIREAALNTALQWGSAPAWQAALYAYKDPRGAEAMVWLACLGDDTHATAIAGQLDDPDHRHDALWALGFSGRVSAVDACMPWLDDDDDLTRRLAGEAVAAIVGLDPDDEGLWEPTVPDTSAVGAQGDDPRDDDDDFEADLGLRPEDELPLPRADAIRARWAELRPGLSPQGRYVLGQPVDETQGPGWALPRLSCRRLDISARELVARSHGAVTWPGRARTQRHLQTLDRLTQLASEPGALRGPRR